MRLVIPENFGIPPIPAGWYRVSVIGNEVQTSKEGNQMINWHMRVESQGSDPAVPTVGRMLFERSVIVEKCLLSAQQSPKSGYRRRSSQRRD